MTDQTILSEATGLIRCTCCGERLRPNREVWLELDQRTSTYTADIVPAEYSQGGFPFGIACARRAEAEHKAAIAAPAQMAGDER